jgi:hypothetical protein
MTKESLLHQVDLMLRRIVSDYHKNADKKSAEFASKHFTLHLCMSGWQNSALFLGKLCSNFIVLVA